MIYMLRIYMENVDNIQKKMGNASKEKETLRKLQKETVKIL